jgi:oxygen-independent coproporphyrinogen III oxidase
MTLDTCSISLYIHIPFCRQKCNYCDFLSWPNRMEMIDTYVETLLKEIEHYQQTIENRKISTIFFGGGTPSLLSGSHVSRILKTIASVSSLSADTEISMEANPEQLTAEKLAEYYDSGVNRLSIGLQTTDPNLLLFLGRRHTSADFFSAVAAARSTGFTNLNADLIFGIPGQTFEGWQETLERVAAEGLQHISCYGLTYEEDTPLYEALKNKVFQPVDEDLEWKMYRYAIRTLQQKGYRHYEISNYARPGKQCRHNLTYWENKEYLGLGAGAHGFVDERRYENTSNLSEYIRRIEQKKLPVRSSHLIGLKESVSETMFLGLRLREGISETLFKKRYGQPISYYYPEEIDHLVKKGWLHRKDDHIRLTETGFDLANQVFAALLLD